MLLLTAVWGCRMSAQEEVLYAAMADSRRTLMQFERLLDLIKAAKEREERQFERLHFCLKKARGDAAYIKALEGRQGNHKSR